MRKKPSPKRRCLQAHALQSPKFKQRVERNKRRYYRPEAKRGEG